jgi:hypothetical protein
MSTRKPSAKAPQQGKTKSSKLKDLTPSERAARQVKGGLVKRYIGETEKN